MQRGKIVIYKDGSHFYMEDGLTWEFENDEDWLATIDIGDENLKKIEYYFLQQRPNPNRWAIEPDKI